MKKETQLNYDLYEAVRSRDIEKVKLLVSQGANINKRLKNSDATILAAIALSDKEILCYLLTHGADLNSRYKDGETPLHYAVGCRNLEITELLLEYGANIDAIDNHGNTPLWYACYDWHYCPEINMVAYLLSKGANPLIVNNYELNAISWSLHDPSLKPIFEKYGFSVL